MEKLKIQIESIGGSVLFKYEKEDGTVRDALIEAVKSGANLSGANLIDADLRGANLIDATLSGADLSESTFGVTINCPEEGSFIAYKKCRGKIVKLFIPEDAKRSSATTYKCRASKASCLEIEDGLTEIASSRDADFIYRVGETMEVPDFDDNRWNECSTGIHFFVSRAMAEAWNG